VTVPGRHWWARVAPGTVPRLLAGTAAGDAHDVLAWLARGRPFVVRARRDGEAGDRRPLALARPRPLPGVAFSVGASEVLDWSPPVPLRAAIDAMPNAWRSAARTLEAALREAGIAAGVFGSAAWGVVAGEVRMRPDSDLDVVVPVGDRGALEAALARLAAAQAVAPGRIDAECVWPDGRAAHWRELSTDAPTVLTKHPDGASIERRDALLAALA
jgi:phosphoribosyl-dephospho-CoA transferase